MPSNPLLNLQGTKPKDTYHRLVQTADGKFYDGLGNEVEVQISSTDGRYNQELIGVIDGINTVFSTSEKYLLGTTRIYQNGLRLKLGAEFDYIEVDDQTIQFTEPPWEEVQMVIDYNAKT
jgi:hypothetical protein